MSEMISIRDAKRIIDYKQSEVDRLIDKLTIKHINMQELIDRGNHLAFLVLNGQQHEKEYAIKKWRKTVEASKN